MAVAVAQLEISREVYDMNGYTYNGHKLWPLLMARTYPIVI